jgi:photosystem II stability/assembly factor-like uncharacterized protein
MRSLTCRLVFAAAPVLAVSIFSLAGPARAQDGVWESVGPHGGSIVSLTVAPGDARVLYSGTLSGQVFRSANAGASWTDVTGDFPPASIADLEVDPRNPSKAYAAVCAAESTTTPAEGGLFRTTDAGASWSLVEGLDVCQVLDLAIDPRNPARLFAGTVSGLYRSDDGGTSWRAQTGPPLWTTVTAVLFDPSAPGTLYALDDEKGFVKSSNGGATWKASNRGLPTPRQRLSGLTVSTDGPKTLYLRTSGDDVPLYRSLDGGGTWSPAASGLGTRNVYGLAAGASPPRVYAATNDGVFRSTDRGRTWKAPAVGTAFASVRVLAVPPGATAVVHAGNVHGLFKSADRGATWVDANDGLPTLSIQKVLIAPSNEEALYARPELPGLLVSLDGGATWSQEGPGTGDRELTMAVHPKEPRTAFAAGVEGGIWRTTNAGASWRRLPPAGGCLSMIELAIDPQTPANLYAGGFSDPACTPQTAPPCNGVRSTDGGLSWSCMPDFPRGSAVQSFAIAPSQPSTLYAGTTSPTLQPVLKTVDGGRIWSPSSGGLQQPSVYTVAVSPEDPRAVYALSQDGLARSADGAATWTPVRGGLPAGAHLASLVIAPSDPSVLYVVAVGASAEDPLLFQSTDRGATWSPLSGEGLPAGPIPSLQVSPRDPRTVYAATRGGVYRVRVR